MNEIWLQFSDEGMTQICGWSWWEQPLETWPYQAEVDTSDARYVAYYEEMPQWAQSYMPVPPKD